MYRALPFLFTFLIVGLLPKVLLADDAEAATETKLRGALRDTMLQLRDAQNQLASLQADKDAADKTNADLKTQLDAANDKIKTMTETDARNQADWDAAKTDLNNQLDQQKTQVAALNASLAQWKAAYAQVDALDKATDAVRQKLAVQVIDLQRLVMDRETKNLQLYQTANEILTRYDKFTLGEALAAKEPFIGVTRTKLQNLVQDYKDKIDQGLAPEAPKEAMVTPRVP